MPRPKGLPKTGGRVVVQAPPSSLAGPVDLVITQPDGETELVRLL
jgi:hypothetical protein